MGEESILSFIIDIFLGGIIGLVSASISGHFGFRSADRLPGESRFPHCFYCLRPLQIHEYFPLLGWVLRFDFSKFTCPCGKKTGQWIIPLIELMGFVLGAAVVFVAGWTTMIIPVCVALGILVAISFIDLAFGIIPDGLNILLGVLGIVASSIGEGDVYLSLIGSAGLLGLGLLLAITYSKIRKKEMLGLGDVKFFAAAGLWLPITMIPWFLVISGVLGIVLGVIWKYVFGEKEFPFAPALCLSLAGFLYYQLYIYNIGFY